MELDFTKVVGIATIISALGALAGIIFGIHKIISSYREKKRRIKIKTAPAFGIHGRQPTTRWIAITALNPGNRTVTFNQPGDIILPGTKEELVYFLTRPTSSVDFPHELSEGKSCTTWMEGIQISQVLKEKGFSGTVKLRGFYRDALGVTHKSKPFKFDIESWGQN